MSWGFDGVGVVTLVLSWWMASSSFHPVSVSACRCRGLSFPIGFLGYCPGPPAGKSPTVLEAGISILFGRGISDVFFDRLIELAVEF